MIRFHDFRHCMFLDPVEPCFFGGAFFHERVSAVIRRLDARHGLELRTVAPCTDVAAGGIHGMSRIYAPSGPRPTTSNDSSPCHPLSFTYRPCLSCRLVRFIITHRHKQITVAWTWATRNISVPTDIARDRLYPPRYRLSFDVSYDYKNKIIVAQILFVERNFVVIIAKLIFFFFNGHEKHREDRAIRIYATRVSRVLGKFTRFSL